MRIDPPGGWNGLATKAEPEPERISAGLWKEQQARRTPPPPGTYSAALAQPPGLPAQGTPPRPGAQPARRDERVREQPRPAGREAARADSAQQGGATCADGEAGPLYLGTGQRGGGQDRQDQGDQSGAQAAAADKAASKAAAAAELDQLAGELAALAAPGSDDGLFELLLPGDEKLAVLVSSSAGAVRFMLTPGSAALKKQLDGQRMELERRLEQRIGRTTRLTVL